jgi:uncharacterized lipoprotein YbaY
VSYKNLLASLPKAARLTMSLLYQMISDADRYRQQYGERSIAEDGKESTEL